ncbi:2-dehydro-3-deoxygalactonokinase [Paracoccaceae bacterium GXU_MW_L88]
MSGADWIAADWGTSNLRVWAMAGAKPVDHRASEKGMGALLPDEFAPHLSEITADWGPLPVVACGMVGSRQGWIEAPYRAVPTSAAPHLVRAPGDRPVWIAGGVKQDDPPDVMRGEETQIAGLLARDPEFDGVVCLPGTHTKWVRISAGEICFFQSFMTGELFSLLAKQSVLRHTVGTPDIADPAFSEAAQEAMDRPQIAYGKLFQLRSGALLGDLAPDTAAARLSGLLVGLELASAKPYWLGQRIAMIGNDALSAGYEAALAPMGAMIERYETESVTLAGLTAAWTTLKETL